MANYPKHQKTLIIREINANTYETFFDYWFDTQRLKRACDELHTVWSGPPPKPSDTKPPSLKEEVKAIIDCLIEGDCLNDEDVLTLRRALESLPD